MVEDRCAFGNFGHVEVSKALNILPVLVELKITSYVRVLAAEFFELSVSHR